LVKVKHFPSLRLKDPKKTKKKKNRSKALRTEREREREREKERERKAFHRNSLFCSFSFSRLLPRVLSTGCVTRIGNEISLSP